jgi:uridine phosphorylase
MPTYTYPILQNKHYSAASVFKPENLLREARRQLNIQECPVPDVCVLDPDGDLTNYLLQQNRAEKNECWACYHSTLYSFALHGREVGIIPCIVGASYAVLVAEQLFVSGCSFLISVTSAGILHPPDESKRFALITEATRDEGTSYHYLPSDQPSTIRQSVYESLGTAGNAMWLNGKSWTTDAPYRETETAIEAMTNEGVMCVEMEAAALYAFAHARNRDVACFAHLTNTMAQEEGDFEKGQHFGSLVTLELIEAVLQEKN